MMITKDMEIALKSDMVCLYLAADICADKGMPSLHQQLLRIRGNVLEAINERASLLERVKVLEEALNPFVDKADLYERNHPSSGQYKTRDSTQITHRLGDFTTARAILNSRS